MSNVTVDNFKCAAADIGANGDNDTLPFDLDCRFIRDEENALVGLADAFYRRLEGQTKKAVADEINALNIFSERIMAPTGSAGFRITTKIHPFWNLYFNGLGVAIAERNEPRRSTRAHSYRYVGTRDALFDRSRSWRAYREATLADPALRGRDGYVVQTDISSFYEHVYHHRLENYIEDLFETGSTLAKQIDRFLSKFASGRSFGLPVGGQCARILAEVMMTPVDRALDDEGVIWHRYVDDFTLITPSQEDAYRALSILSHILADYGLSLNRTKTTILKFKHYTDYVKSQLGTAEPDAAGSLRDLDLYFDPYSDREQSEEMYEELRDAVTAINIQLLLELELQKAQPDTYLVTQIGRAIRFHSPEVAVQICATLLAPKNLNAFRASWSTIMRGVSAVRAREDFASIHESIDQMLDEIPMHASHLLLPEANTLHYLKTIRFQRTGARGRFVLGVHSRTRSETVKRACIECWREWRDRHSFISLRQRWNTLGSEEQRMLWLAARDFGDDGRHYRSQVRPSLPQVWSLGIEEQGEPTFWLTYKEWADRNA